MTDHAELISWLRLFARGLQISDNPTHGNDEGLNLAADALSALVAERDALAAEVARMRTPEWFYSADDGEYTYGDVSDTVDDMGHEGVMRVGGAREVWEKWVAVRCVALDADGEVDETEVMTFDSEDEALRCWPESLAIARAALAQGGEP